MIMDRRRRFLSLDLSVFLMCLCSMISSINGKDSFLLPASFVVGGNPSEVTEYDLLQAVKIPFQDPKNQYMDNDGHDGFPGFGFKAGSDVKVALRQILPEKLPSEFSIWISAKPKSRRGGFLFAVVNPYDTVVELGVKIAPEGFTNTLISLYYSNASSINSQVVANFSLPRFHGKWSRLAFRLTEENVTLFFNCNEVSSVNVKRIPAELQFDSASTLYIAQAGSVLGEPFEVVLIFGISGACRCDELVNITVDDLEDMGSLLLINIPNTKTNKSRTFNVLGDEYLSKYRKYVNLRLVDFRERRFFLKYQNGKCYKAVMGIHKISSVAKDVALYLKISNWKEYTGHCLRRTSATMLVDSGVDITTLKRHGGWKSDTVAEGYIEDSVQSKTKIAKRILQPSSAENLEQSSFNEPDISNGFVNTVHSGKVVMNSTDIVRSGGFLNDANLHNCTFTINITNK